jgi:hypothetical protein
MPRRPRLAAGDLAYHVLGDGEKVSGTISDLMVEDKKQGHGDEVESRHDAAKEGPPRTR